MTLKAEATAPASDLRDAVNASLRAITKLGGETEIVPKGSLPNDGRVISDERSA